MQPTRYNTTSRPAARRLVLAAALILALPGLAGCLGGGDPEECRANLVQVAGDCQRLECNEAGEEVSAADDSDRPQDMQCREGSCSNGTPTFLPLAKGTVVADVPGDCRVTVCDGTGQGESVASDKDKPQDMQCSLGSCASGSPTFVPLAQGTVVADEPGDCQVTVCDGTGRAESVPKDEDVRDDMNACTADVCTQGTPSNPPLAQGTLVSDNSPGDCKNMRCDGQGGMSLANDDSDTPAEDGLVCTASTCNAGAPSHAAVESGTSCAADDGFVCHADLRCDPCPDPGPGCPDNGYGEPNDTQAEARDFGTLQDPDGNAQAFCAVLSGTSDVDWFTYYGRDTFSGLVNPYQFISNGSKARVCAYFKCDSTNTYLTCPATTQPSTAPNGARGCCGEGPFKVDKLSCDGNFSDHARVWIRVDNPRQEACSPYYFKFNY